VLTPLVRPDDERWHHRTIGSKGVSVLRADGAGNVVIVAETPLDVIAVWKLRNYRASDEDRDLNAIWVSLNSVQNVESFLECTLRRANVLVKESPKTRLRVVVTLNNNPDSEKAYSVIRGTLVGRCEVSCFFSHYAPTPCFGVFSLSDREGGDANAGNKNSE